MTVKEDEVRLWGSELSCPPAISAAAASLMSSTPSLPKPVSTAHFSMPPQHFLHVFPSFGIGGVPLRIVRIINHFARRFRHTVIALDNDFEAAEGFGCDLDVKLLPMRHPKGRTLHTVARSAVSLRRLRPDLLLTYNWGAIEWAMEIGRAHV